jgi:hypothetical protein
MVGLCLVAVFAMAAVVATSASALPEWGKCVAKAGGKFTDSNCTKKATLKEPGRFEWLKASQVAEKRVAEGKSKNVPFSGGTVGTGAVLTSLLRWCNKKEPDGSAGPGFTTTRKHCEEIWGPGQEGAGTTETTNIECTKETNTGETEGTNKVAKVEVVFTGCVYGGTNPCNSEGRAEGEIATSTLKGKLGYIKKSAKEVGLDLEPAKSHGTFAAFSCVGGILKIKVGVGNSKEGAENVKGTLFPTGCYGVCPGATPEEEKSGGYDDIISPITPVNMMTLKYTQVYTEESGYPYRNLPTHLEGKHLSVLEDLISAKTPELSFASDWSAAGEVLTNVNTSEEEGEIKA